MIYFVWQAKNCTMFESIHVDIEVVYKKKYKYMCIDPWMYTQI